MYDGRTTTDFDFNHDLPQLDSKLPRWRDGDFPEGSYAVVGYTMTCYQTRKGTWRLGCNIHWAILLGLPDAVALNKLKRY
jgi:hypothetical protein